MKLGIGNFFSTLGKSLQLPVAVLPLAGILVGVGLALIGDPNFDDKAHYALIRANQISKLALEVSSTTGKSSTDLIDILPSATMITGEEVVEESNVAVKKAGLRQTIGMFLRSAGLAIIGQLPLIFALGLAIGFAHDHHGSAVLSAFVGYSILLAGITMLNPITSPDLPINLGVFSGIFIGPIAGILYNRYGSIKLPSALAFFGGKRFVPIVTGGVAMVLATILAIIWPYCQRIIENVGNMIIEGGAVGQFSYGFLNRMLIPVGLHQILNAIVWFDLGSFTNAAGSIVRGDLWRYWAGDPSAGVFMVGFFPVIMFGLPAACAAMVVTAKKNRKAAVAGMLGSMAFTSFLTGITEPIEFSFMFLAFPLYIIHAVLTGLSHVIMNLLHARVGFTFSAGLIDYVLSYNLGSNQLFVILVGLVYAILYFAIFVSVIKFFNLKTPGREEDDGDESLSPMPVSKGAEAYRIRALQLIEGLGGKSNIQNIDACATRLRVEVKSNSAISEVTLKLAGAKGVFNKTEGNTQVIIGPEANDLADMMNSELKN